MPQKRMRSPNSGRKSGRKVQGHDRHRVKNPLGKRVITQNAQRKRTMQIGIRDIMRRP